MQNKHITVWTVMAAEPLRSALVIATAALLVGGISVLYVWMV